MFRATQWFLKGEAAETMAKYVLGFYANFYHNGCNCWGAKLTNRAGQTWQAYGDHRLGDSKPHRAAVIAAADESIERAQSRALTRPAQAGAASVDARPPAAR